MMMEIALSMPEYAVSAKQVKLLDVSADDYYGKGYQDVENRLPSIEHTRKELGWEPKVDMKTALKKLFEFYRGDVGKARALTEESA